MKNTKEIKLMIIENYIDWTTSDEEEREIMKKMPNYMLKKTGLMNSPI